jgi:hypothetical protein
MKTLILVLLQLLLTQTAYSLNHDNGYRNANVSSSCKLTNLTKHQNPIRLGNFVVNLAAKSGLIKKLASKMNPMIFNDTFTFPPEIGNLGFVSYNFKLSFDRIKISGLDTVSIRPMKVLDAYHIQLGGSLGKFIVSVPIALNLSLF